MERGGRLRHARNHVLTWFTGAALALGLLFVAGLLSLIAWNGLLAFWPKPVYELELADGSTVLGEIHERERAGAREGQRVRVRTGNRDLLGIDFRWIDESEITGRSLPEDVLLLEREEWGPFYGRLLALRREDDAVVRGEAAWQAFREVHARKRAQFERVDALEDRAIGDVNYAIENLRLEQRALALEDLPPAERARREAGLAARIEAEESRYRELARELAERRRVLEAETIRMQAAGGREKEILVSHVVRAVPANRLDLGDRLALFASRIWEFLSAEPRESNTEGGVFPAIFGTVMMVLLMSVAVVPFGVIAAVYLHEYAREGALVRLVRIAVNNLAGVPSIVFGVFGLGFFVYALGGSLDALFYPEALPAPTLGTGGILWASLTLALLTVPVVVVAAEEGLSAVPRAVREGSRALGATQIETLWRVVIPASAPGILTGLVLAVARAAGEVAPLMLVGVVKLAPALPVDHHFPFVHLERKFMHLGFHIFDVGFQSPNVEAAKPLVFATALLLVGLVLVMNLAGIVLRERLRTRYRSSAV